MGLALLAITAVKLMVAGWLEGTADVPQMLAQARTLLDGGDLLNPASTESNRSLFFLGHYGLAALCLELSRWVGGSFAFWIKVPAILADLGIAWLLRSSPRGGDVTAFLYLCNPVTLLLSAYHGQLHTVAVAATVLAFYLAERGRWVISGLALGLAVSVRQHFAPLIMPLAWRSGRACAKVAAGFTCALGLLAAPVVFHSLHPEWILAPTWKYGSWGYTMLLLQGPRMLTRFGFGDASSVTDGLNHAVQTVGPVIYWVWATWFLWWAWRHRTVDPWGQTLCFLLGLYTVSPGFGVQWLIWVIPFWLLVSRRDAMRYSILAGAFLAGSYWQWGLNAKYGVESLTANLSVLQPLDFLGVCGVGVLGLLTWAYCVRTTWRMLQA